MISRIPASGIAFTGVTISTSGGLDDGAEPEEVGRASSDAGALELRAPGFVKCFGFASPHSPKKALPIYIYIYIEREIHPHVYYIHI